MRNQNGSVKVTCRGDPGGSLWDREQECLARRQAARRSCRPYSSFISSQISQPLELGQIRRSTCSRRSAVYDGPYTAALQSIIACASVEPPNASPRLSSDSLLDKGVCLGALLAQPRPQLQPPKFHIHVCLSHQHGSSRRTIHVSKLAARRAAYLRARQ